MIEKSRMFLLNFMSASTPQVGSSQLLQVIQRRGESIRSYTDRFAMQKLKIKDCIEDNAGLAFMAGLDKDSPLRKELVKEECNTYQEALAFSRKFIRI